MEFGDRWVTSTPITNPACTGSCYIQGKLDSIIRCDDGSYAVIDFKTSNIRPGLLKKYSRQLHAYAYALEHAAQGKLALAPISRLGLLVYEPDTFQEELDRRASLTGELRWMEVKRDDNSFLTFLAEIMGVLDLPAPPEPSPKCDWCAYRGLGT